MKIQALYHQHLSNGDVVDIEKMIRVWMFDIVWWWLLVEDQGQFESTKVYKNARTRG